MANVPATVAQLVETFDRNIEAYKTQPYNEAQLRREFIDPFFEQLGWDVTNKQLWAPAYREVIHEDAIKIGGATEAPTSTTTSVSFHLFNRLAVAGTATQTKNHEPRTTNYHRRPPPKNKRLRLQNRIPSYLRRPKPRIPRRYWKPALDFTDWKVWYEHLYQARD